MKEEEELWRLDCLGDRELDDLDEGAHSKMTRQAIQCAVNIVHGTAFLHINTTIRSLKRHSLLC